METATGLRVRGLRKTFRSGGRTQTVLGGIDFDLRPGEVVGLIGPNGAGKTTLISCVLDFLHPDDGIIEIDGLPNHDLAVRRRTGFVPERLNFARRATGYRFLHYMARLAEVPAAEATDRSHEMLERLGLTAAAGKRLSQYSRGMLQRIGLCQALVHRPDYVFLDEPTSGLDPNGVLLVRDLILEQKQRGAAVLLSSHQLSEVERVCDRVLFLSKGQIGRAETLKEIDRIAVEVLLLPGSFDHGAIAALTGEPPRENAAAFTANGEEEIAAMVRRIVESGAGVIGVQRRRTDLESMFRGAP